MWHYLYYKSGMGVCVSVCVSVCLCVGRRKLYVFRALHPFSSSFSCVGWFGHKCLIMCTDKFGEACIDF